MSLYYAKINRGRNRTVLFGFFQSQDLVRANFLKRLKPATGPAHLDRGGNPFAAQPKVYPLIARGHESNTGRHMVIQRPARRRGELKRRADSVPVAFTTGNLNQKPVVAIICRVEQDSRLLV